MSVLEESSTIANHSMPLPLTFDFINIGFVKRDDGPVYLIVTELSCNDNIDANVYVMGDSIAGVAVDVNVGVNTDVRGVVPTEEYVGCIL